MKLLAAAGLAETGAAVLPVVTDVSSAGDVDALRDKALAAFGAVHVVCNNAGVGGPHGPLWECPPGEWDWVIGVNLGGVVNGVRAFMPVLLGQDAGHMVNTASIVLFQVFLIEQFLLHAVTKCGSETSYSASCRRELLPAQKLYEESHAHFA